MAIEQVRQHDAITPRCHSFRHFEQRRARTKAVHEEQEDGTRPVLQFPEQPDRTMSRRKRDFDFFAHDCTTLGRILKTGILQFSACDHATSTSASICTTSTGVSTIAAVIRTPGASGK